MRRQGGDCVTKNSKARLGAFLAALMLAVCFAAGSVLSLAQTQGDGKKLRTVRVGYYAVSNFQEYDEKSGAYRGYSYDYMLAVAQYAGWEYEFVPVTYNEGLEMLENGQLDLMNDVHITDDLAQRLSYSSLPSGTSCTCLVVPQDNTDVAYEDFKSISGLTVGLDYSSELNSGFVDYCKDNDCMPALIYYHSASGVARGMESGKINAYLVSDLQDVAMRTVAKFNARSYYFATTKGNSDLLQELDAAMNSLKTEDPYFEEKIYAKYHGKSAEEQTVISDEEKAFVRESAAIKVAYDPAWYPVSYTKSDGGFGGAMASVFQLISEKTGLKFEYVPKETGAQALESLKNGEVQVYAGFPYDYTWAEQNNARVTTPFITMTVFAAYRAGAGQGNSYAVPEGSYLRYLSGTIRRDGYDYAEYGSTDACLDAVLNGQADFAFLDSYELEYYRERAAYRNLAFKVANGEDYNLSIAVSDASDERLYTIISKALASAGTDEIGNILRETTIEATSRSLLDVLYSNPRTAGILFLLFGFIIAVAISALVYTRVISKKNLQLKAATNAKSEFLSSMSHDMRTPLNGILGYTDLALKAENKSDRIDYLNKIKISGNFLLSLINDTLDISKIESGKLVLKPEPVDFGELLESIIVPIRQAADEKGVTFTVDTDGMTGGYIMADRLNLQKVILNLLSNAVKFTPSGGTAALSVSDVEPKEGKVNTLITVSDTGVGMGDEFMSKMFEPFTQERASGSESNMGTGLGLSIVKSIVDIMGGRIEVSSRRGSGSRFDVYLPIEHIDGHGHEQAGAAADARDQDALRGKKVLLCEDNDMNREIAENILRGFGMSVTSSANGRECVDIFSASPVGGFDVILMDLRMPVLDGLSAAKEIRALERKDSGVPIIAMSADAYEDAMQKCLKAGMDGHLPKPIDTAELKKTLIRFCGDRRGERS